jgi:hypothetical protein
MLYKLQKTTIEIYGNMHVKNSFLGGKIKSFYKQNFVCQPALYFLLCFTGNPGSILLGLSEALLQICRTR